MRSPKRRDTIRRMLSVIRAHPYVTALLLMAYSIAVTLPHESVQGWLGAHVVQPMGRGNFYLLMAMLGTLGLGVAGWLIARHLPHHPARPALRNYSLLTLALVLMAWRFLTVNNSELIHFGQYAVTGFVLMAWTLSVTETLSAVLLLGGIDEAHQYAVLHANWGIPYDFNDVVLDFLGGSIGVLLCLLWLRARPREGAAPLLRPGTLLLAITVLGGALLLLTNHAVVYQDPSRSDYLFAISRLPKQGFWFFDATWGPRTIHAIAPLEGPVLLLGLLFLYGQLDRKYQFGVAQ